MMLHRYYMHMTHIVRHDPLTGLNNKMIFEERLKHAILEGKRTGRRYALVLLDINNFNKVNKKLGHYIGDGLLKQLAKRLRSSLRETDSLARLEKDNFAFLLEFSDEDKVSSIIEKIYQSLSAGYTVYGRQVKVSISIGVAVYPDFALDREDLELKANEALIRAQQGAWPVVYAQPLAELMDHSGLSLIQSLHQALDNNEFLLVYQPVIALKTHTTRYFEALLRWKYPQQHSQSIEKTIQLAEKNQLIKPLSQWIVEEACEQLTRLQDGVVKIAVNLSMIDLHDEELPDRVAATISQYGVTADRLMIEITEGQIMQEPDQVIKTLTSLSQMGISLSIDDFGTGQASLTYLKKLPVEKLKIDQSFVKDMVTNEDDRTIVEATIKLAHTLGIEVVAEGVESAEIFELLLHMGCDFVQGYYISRPIQKEQIAEWLMAKVRPEK
jgi:diguanylate cyclase (GGDEF)-like protein